MGRSSDIYGVDGIEGPSRLDMIPVIFEAYVGNRNTDCGTVY